MINADLISNWLSDARFRLRAVFRRAAVERELDDELRFHLDRETEKLASAGVDRTEASRRARVAFGGVDRVKEDTRDARGVRLLEMVVRDLRYAIRGLRAHPGFTLAVVATLALGIGVNTAMFGIVDRLMFRPLAYLRDPGSVNRVYLHYDFRQDQITTSTMQFRRYLDLAQNAGTLSQSAAFHFSHLAIGTGEEAREMNVAIVSASYFGFFDARPVMGRFFDSLEDSPRVSAQVVVIGDALWKTRFGGRNDVLGQQLQIGSLNATIIGVAPAGFVGADPTEPVVAFIPIPAYASLVEASYTQKYNWEWLYMIVRRRPGVSIAAATANLTQAYRRSWETEQAMSSSREPIARAQPRAVVAPMQEFRGPEAGRDAPIILWICGVAAIVLLIACANVANLLLGRAFGRKREIAVRLAIGVSRRRLIAQLLTESLLLAILTGVAGVLIGEGGQSILRKLFLPKAASVGVLDDPRTIVFAVVVALIAGILTGLAPALQSGRGDLVTALKSGAREGVHQRSRTRSALLLAQGALSVILLVGAGLFVQSLHNVTSIRLGYDVDPVLYVSTNLRGLHLPTDQDRRLITRLSDEARTIPGVSSVSQVMTVPLYEMMSESFSVPGIDSADRRGHFSAQMGTTDYFRTIGTRILRGRGFDSTDRGGSPLVVIVSDGMAKKLWPNQNALGKCVKFGDDTTPCSTVIGISENIKANDVVGDESLQYYRSIDQVKPPGAAVFVRSRGDARSLAEIVRKRLQPLMPGTSYITVTPMRDIVDPALASWRMGATMFTLFGVLALTLAAIGLYSVIAYDVAQRTHELGLRVALGARARDVLRLVVKEGMRYALAGIVIGAAIALAAAHWVQPLLFGETARDPLVFAIVAVILIAVAAAASAIPALRAVRVDPSVALRTE